MGRCKDRAFGGVSSLVHGVKRGFSMEGASTSGGDGWIGIGSDSTTRERDSSAAFDFERGVTVFVSPCSLQMLSALLRDENHARWMKDDDVVDARAGTRNDA